MAETEDFYYLRAKGHFTSYIAQGHGRPETITKTIWTELRKAPDPKHDLDRLLDEVEKEAVVDFEKSDSTIFREKAQTRRARFGGIKTLLLDQRTRIENLLEAAGAGSKWSVMQGHGDIRGAVNIQNKEDGRIVTVELSRADLDDLPWKE